MKYTALKSLIKRLPEYAQDVKGNIYKLFSTELKGLTIKQMYGIALTVGYFLKNEQMLNDIRAEAKVHLEESDATAAKSAVIITAMASTFYGFNNTVQDAELKKIPIDLQMTVYSDSGVSKADFELYCLAVANLLQSEYCIDKHIERLISYGVSKEAIYNVSRIASVLRAAMAALEIENIRSYDFIARGPTF